MDRKQIRYVYWSKEAQIIHIENDEKWDELINSFDPDKKINNPAGVKTLRAMWNNGKWAADIKGNMVYIYTKDLDGYKIYVSPQTAEGKNKEEIPISGMEARNMLAHELLKTNGKSFQARFGGIAQTADKFVYDKESGMSNLEVVAALHRINQNVGPFIGNASLLPNQNYEGVNKADVDSAYPNQAVNKILPTLKDSKIIKGYVEPTAEFPFVFYLESNHIAIYNELDTHRDCFHPLYKNFRPDDSLVVKRKMKKEYRADFLRISKEKEICLCCKASEFNLEEFLIFHGIKSRSEGIEKTKAKAVLNLTIGTFDMVNCPNYSLLPYRYTYFGHLRAVILARHNHSMMNYYDEIVKRGGRVLQVQTDSIMWQGEVIESVKREKGLGNLVLEIESGKAFIHGCGAYWIEDNNKHIEKHQGLANFPAVNSMEEFKKALTDKNTNIHTTLKRLNTETLRYE